MSPHTMSVRTPSPTTTSDRDLDFTRHANERALQRHLPDCVRDAFARGLGVYLLGRHPHHPRVMLRIVRTRDAYWIAPHVRGVVLTIYERLNDGVHAWAYRYLHNPLETAHRLPRIPIHVMTPEQTATEELLCLWVED
jgi:hypothetical protein